MKTITDLQTLIENRAEENLKKEIKKFLESFTNHKFFKALEEKTSPKNNVNMGDWLYYESEDTAFKLIYNAFLPEYIETELKAFLSKVENIQSEIDELKNSMQ